MKRMLVLHIVQLIIVYFTENRGGMSQHVAQILEEIGQLAPDEVAELFRELSSRIDRQQQARTILANYRGKGAGVWPDEPQQYVNSLRDDERL